MKLASHGPFGWSLSLVMIITPLAPTVHAYAHGSKIEGQQAEQRQRLADKLERGFELLEETAQQIPRETFDVDAILAEVGEEPEALFAWVRDNPYWVPYTGSLRGSVGVLMDRLGNSLDRSLLLAELLRRSGHQCRLARAQLSEEQAHQLQSKLAPVPQGWSPKEQGNPDASKHDWEQLAVDRGLEPAELRGGPVR